MTAEEEARVSRGIASARVVWSSRDELIDDYEGPVEILTNGWVRLPPAGCYYPPHEVEKIEELNNDTEDSE